jgi:iron-sulfur cluster repair protein YtfE (RIC family)
MKRHPALHPLSHDHHQGLILAQQLKKGAPQYKGMPSTLEDKKEYTLSFYKSELAKHFQGEEEILFPYVTGKNAELDKLISEIISEHRRMERLINALENNDNLESKMDELGWLLEQHIRKEERELFPAIEEILTEGQLSELKTKLNPK